jgi:hypothetical protein
MASSSSSAVCSTRIYNPDPPTHPHEYPKFTGSEDGFDFVGGLFEHLRRMGTSSPIEEERRVGLTIGTLIDLTAKVYENFVQRLSYVAKRNRLGYIGDSQGIVFYRHMKNPSETTSHHKMFRRFLSLFDLDAIPYAYVERETDYANIAQHMLVHSLRSYKTGLGESRTESGRPISNAMGVFLDFSPIMLFPFQDASGKSTLFTISRNLLLSVISDPALDSIPDLGHFHEDLRELSSVFANILKTQASICTVSCRFSFTPIALSTQHSTGEWDFDLLDKFGSGVNGLGLLEPPAPIVFSYISSRPFRIDAFESAFAQELDRKVRETPQDVIGEIQRKIQLVTSRREDLQEGSGEYKRLSVTIGRNEEKLRRFVDLNDHFERSKSLHVVMRLWKFLTRQTRQPRVSAASFDDWIESHAALFSSLLWGVIEKSDLEFGLSPNIFAQKARLVRLVDDVPYRFSHRALMNLQRLASTDSSVFDNPDIPHLRTDTLFAYSNSTAYPANVTGGSISDRCDGQPYFDDSHLFRLGRVASTLREFLGVRVLTPFVFDHERGIAYPTPFLYVEDSSVAISSVEDDTIGKTVRQVHRFDEIWSSVDRKDVADRAGPSFALVRTFGGVTYPTASDVPASHRIPTDAVISRTHTYVTPPLEVHSKGRSLYAMRVLDVEAILQICLSVGIGGSSLSNIHAQTYTFSVLSSIRSMLRRTVCSTDNIDRLAILFSSHNYGKPTDTSIQSVKTAGELGLWTPKISRSHRGFLLGRIVGSGVVTFRTETSSLLLSAVREELQWAVGDPSSTRHDTPLKFDLDVKNPDTGKVTGFGNVHKGSFLILPSDGSIDRTPDRISNLFVRGGTLVVQTNVAPIDSKGKILNDQRQYAYISGRPFRVNILGHEFPKKIVESTLSAEMKSPMVHVTWLVSGASSTSSSSGDRPSSSSAR